MTATAPADGAAGGRTPSRQRRRRQYLPPQHGAWAMLLLPYLVALVTAGATWAQIPLLIAWLSGYLLSYYAFLAVKTRRISRVRPQLRLYAAIAVPAGVLTVALCPRTLWFAPAYAGLLAINAWYAWHHDDRALANDLASVIQGCLMIPVAAMVAGVSPVTVLEPFGVVLLYFVGTVLFVKTMIRERGDNRFLRGSIGYHAAAVVAAGLLAWPWAILFGWFLVRAAWLPRFSMTPKQVGFVEIGNCVALLALVAVVAG